MSRVTKIVESADLRELQEIERELKEGTITALLEKRLSQAQLDKTCPVCNRPVAREKALVLEFGPVDFRQRAIFDGIDCLEYFITHMKKMKQNEDEYF